MTQSKTSESQMPEHVRAQLQRIEDANDPVGNPEGWVRTQIYELEQNDLIVHSLGEGMRRAHLEHLDMVILNAKDMGVSETFITRLQALRDKVAPVPNLHMGDPANFTIAPVAEPSSTPSTTLASSPGTPEVDEHEAVTKP